MSGRAGLADAAVDAFGQGGIKGRSRSQHDEQRHEGLAPQVFQIDHQAVEHFGQDFHRAVDFSGAHANTMAVDGGV